jgi:hypothetical protein
MEVEIRVAFPLSAAPSLLRVRGLTFLFFLFVSDPPQPFARPNNRSALNFDYSPQNT